MRAGATWEARPEVSSRAVGRASDADPAGGLRADGPGQAPAATPPRDGADPPDAPAGRATPRRAGTGLTVYRGGVTTRVAGILLAAGAGSRLGQPKALVELGGQTLAQRGVGVLLDGGADPVLVVTGAARVSVAGAWIVRNLDWRTG